MAKQVASTGLAARLGEAGRKAVELHRNDEVRLPGGGSLPEGIENGIAQLADCRFRKYEKGDNKGKDYLYLVGVVKLPTEVNGLPVYGLQTRLMLPCCQTKTSQGKVKTLDDNIAEIINRYKMLGVDTSDFTLDNLEPTAEALKEFKPHFRLRTWKGDKQTTGPYAGKEPRVNEVWGEACDYTTDETDELQDDTQTEQEEPQTETEQANENESTKVDLVALAEQADAGEDAAIIELSTLAEAAGVDHTVINTWAEVVEAINAATEGGDAEAEETPWVPAKEDVYYYKAPGKRVGVQCEVTAVFENKQLVNLKNCADPKLVYKGIAWDKLKEEA